MCYDTKYLTKKEKSYLSVKESEAEWKKIKDDLKPTYHASGFASPLVPGLTNTGALLPMRWNPFAIQKGYNTLNARDDKLNTSKFWKEDFEDRRGLVILDGFYDSHEHNGRKFPFYIEKKDKQPLAIGAIYRKHENGEISTSLITTRANKEMAWIHNEPAFSPESRMMLCIEPKDFEYWLTGHHKDVYKDLIKPLPNGVLTYHPCNPIKSNKKNRWEYLGNVPETSERKDYPELNTQQTSLF